jgi:hypothetical protein
MNVSVNFNLMTTTLSPTWMGLILGYLLVIMPIIRLISTLYSIVTDGAIDRLGAFGCLLYLFSLDAQFKPTLSIVLLCGIILIDRSLADIHFYSWSSARLGSALFLTQRFVLLGFPEGLAAFLCLGFPPSCRFLFGGNPRIKRRRIKKRQDSESRQRAQRVFGI